MLVILMLRETDVAQGSAQKPVREQVQSSRGSYTPDCSITLLDFQIIKDYSPFVPKPVSQFLSAPAVINKPDGIHSKINKEGHPP